MALYSIEDGKEYKIPTTTDIEEHLNVNQLHKDITAEEFEETCLQLLKDMGKLNTITRVMVTNIVSLYETALDCGINIKNNGVMIETVGSTGQVIMKRNEAVMLQDKVINSIGKLLAQLELDKVIEMPESEV